MIRHMHMQVDSDRLKMLAKQASALHLRDGVPLTEAVVCVLKDQPGLSTDHVRRVTEFSNNDTFQAMFEKEAGDHRVINFNGGPADPSVVLKELNMSASPSPMAVSDSIGSVRSFVPGQDSAGDPFETEKNASAAEYPMARPNGEALDLRDRLNGARQHFLSKVASLGVMYDEAVGRMYKEARQLVLDGVSPAAISHAISRTSSDVNMTKLALKRIQGYMQMDDLPAVPMRKQASGIVNPKHPLVSAFQDFEKVAKQRYTFLAAVDLIDEQLNKVNTELKGRWDE